MPRLSARSGENSAEKQDRTIAAIGPGAGDLGANTSEGALSERYRVKVENDCAPRSGFVTELKTLDALRLTFDFVRRHPGFAYRELTSRPT
jgi:hypothetical protein